MTCSGFVNKFAQDIGNTEKFTDRLDTCVHNTCRYNQKKYLNKKSLNVNYDEFFSADVRLICCGFLPPSVTDLIFFVDFLVLIFT